MSIKSPSFSNRFDAANMTKATSPSKAGRIFSPTSDCGSSSDFASQPTSLTDSMAMVNRILADGNLDRVERIEKLEAILTDVTRMALGKRSDSYQALNGGHHDGVFKVDAETQTISTGDISMTRVYSPAKVASSPPP